MIPTGNLLDNFPPGLGGVFFPPSLPPSPTGALAACFFDFLRDLPHGMPTFRTFFITFLIFIMPTSLAPSPTGVLAACFFDFFRHLPYKMTTFRTFAITFLFQNYKLYLVKVDIPPSLPPFLPSLLPSLPPVPAFSLHVFLTFFDTSHTECLLFGPLSLPPLFSHSLPPSLPPLPAFSLHVFLTFCDTSHTECLLFGPFSSLSYFFRSNRTEPSQAGPSLATEVA